MELSQCKMPLIRSLSMFRRRLSLAQRHVFSLDDRFQQIVQNRALAGLNVDARDHARKNRKRASTALRDLVFRAYSNLVEAFGFLAGRVGAERIGTDVLQRRWKSAIDGIVVGGEL